MPRICPVCGGKYYCPAHYVFPSKLKAIEAIKNGTAVKAKIKPIATFSDKRLKEMATYRKVRDQYLKDHPVCEYPGCSSIEVTLHHSCGRTGKLLTDVSRFKSLCLKHHSYIELNPVEAVKMGLSGSRLNTII